MQKTLEVRNANRDSVAIDFYRLSDSNGKIALGDSNHRNEFIIAWNAHSQEDTSLQEKLVISQTSENQVLSDGDLVELNELWHAMDTNGNGKLDLQEIIVSK